MPELEQQKEASTAPSQEEEFNPRGIGENWIACFVCGRIKNGYTNLNDDGPAGEVIPSVLHEDGVHYEGGYYSTQADMAAFVNDRESGLRVKAMFDSLESRVFLDYRGFEPGWVQVKVAACDEHEPILQRLMNLTRKADGKISVDLIKNAIGIDQEPV